MIPTNEPVIPDFEIETETSETYYFDYEKDRVYGKTDGLEAMQQAIYLILNTERFQYPIYSWDYGVALADLIGMERSYVIPEVERRISEALMRDDRILGVKNFAFEFNKGRYHVNFEVSTIYGDVEIDQEVAA